MAGGVVVLGGLNLDYVVRVPALPRPGETITGHDLALHPGGKGANQAVAAGRLGVETAMIGRVGADEAGRRLRTSLSGAGVDIRYVCEDSNQPSGAALIAVDELGQNQIVVAPGANERVGASDVEAAGELIRSARVCLMQLETTLAAVQAAAALARASGGRVILNAAPAAALPAELYALLDLLVVNETEAAALLGIDRLDAPAGAARALLGRGSGAVVLTLGEEGLWLAEATGQRHLPAFASEAVDTTAAGDAFCGGMAAALVRGADLWSACRYGAAAGALAVARVGAQPSLPSGAEVAALLAE